MTPLVSLPLRVTLLSYILSSTSCLSSEYLLLCSFCVIPILMVWESVGSEGVRVVRDVVSGAFLTGVILSYVAAFQVCLDAVRMTIHFVMF